MKHVILGCGDIGRRIAQQLVAQGSEPVSITGFVHSIESMQRCHELLINTVRFDLDSLSSDSSKETLSECHQANLYYTIAPQKKGVNDERSAALLAHFSLTSVKPNKIVLISTTGVYGDCHGEWVTEQSVPKPETERGKRRLDAERQWLAWGRQHQVDVVILRVPGIYAFSRLPRERIAKQVPVVRASECGFTNRIHADDLAMICIAAMQRAKAADVFNATDGTPGTISDYLQQAAKVLGLPALPEISMQEAQTSLSSGMLSYLGESRKISNQKLLDQLGITLRHPDFRQGIQY